MNRCSSKINSLSVKPDAYMIFQKIFHFFWYLATALRFYRIISENIYFVENSSTYRLWISEPDYAREIFYISIQFELILT